eukprot:g40630.t1
MEIFPLIFFQVRSGSARLKSSRVSTLSTTEVPTVRNQSHSSLAAGWPHSPDRSLQVGNTDSQEANPINTEKRIGGTPCTISNTIIIDNSLKNFKCNDVETDGPPQDRWGSTRRKACEASHSTPVTTIPWSGNFSL